MLNKFRMAFGLSPVAPAYAIAPIGDYELRGHRCFGIVIDECNPPRRPLVIQVETRERVLLQVMQAPYNAAHRRYEFTLDLDERVTPCDLLRERACLYATNAFGLRDKLALDGASQLSLIREHMGKPRAVLFDLDFSQGGNAAEFMREGWGGLERDCCCTEGSHAVLELGTGLSGADRHELTIECAPFLAPPAVPEQRMTVTVNGFPQQVVHDGKMLDFLSFIFPTNSMQSQDAITITFDLPTCYAPADVSTNPDRRRLSFAFKRLVLARLLPTNL